MFKNNFSLLSLPGEQVYIFGTDHMAEKYRKATKAPMTSNDNTVT